MNHRTIIDEVLLPWMDEVLEPMGRASRLLAERKLDSLEAMESFVKSLGIEVEYDKRLPTKLAGLSLVVEGTPCMLLNPNGLGSREFTLAHELGHHNLDLSQPTEASKGEKELAASLFALGFILKASPRAYRECLERDLEARMIAAGVGVPFVALLLAAALAWLWSWISSRSRADGELRE